MSKPPKSPEERRGKPNIDPPWKVLWPEDRGATTGDMDREVLLASVGFALSKWEEFEEELSRIFSVMVSATIDRPAMRAYGSVNNFYGRADMLAAAAEAFFYHAKFRKKIAGPDRLIAETDRALNDLMKHARQFAGRRNEIAHGRYVPSPSAGYYLRPAQYNSKKYGFDEKWAGVYAYASHEIYYYADQFMVMANLAKDLRSAAATIAEKIS